MMFYCKLRRNTALHKVTMDLYALRVLFHKNSTVRDFSSSVIVMGSIEGQWDKHIRH